MAQIGKFAKNCDGSYTGEIVILVTAPPLVATALKLIHIDDIPVAEVAQIVALSRFQLHRRIAAFQAVWAAAA